MPKTQLRKIGLWSGASPSTKKDFRIGIQKLRELNIEVISDGKNIRNATRCESPQRKFLAGPDSQKFSALVKLLKDPKIQEIFCVRGGYGTLRLLDLLEKINLKKSAKRIWGFSDQTCLQNYLYLRLGMSWVHSPMLTSNAFFLGSARELAPWQPPSKKPKPLSFTLKRMKGSYTNKSLPRFAPILGGNLTCLSSIQVFAPHRVPKNDFYLFLEDISEKAYRLDRMLVMLKHSGFLKHCRGIFLGYFTECPNWSGVLEKFSHDVKIPVYTGLPSGHDRPNISLPMGKNVDVWPLRKNFGEVEVLFPKLEIRG